MSARRLKKGLTSPTFLSGLMIMPCRASFCGAVSETTKSKAKASRGKPSVPGADPTVARAATCASAHVAQDAFGLRTAFVTDTFGTRLGEAGADAFTIMRLMVTRPYSFTALRSSVARGCRIGVWAIDGAESAKSGHKYWHTRTCRNSGDSVTYFVSICPGGEIGRRNGLKIRFSAREGAGSIPAPGTTNRGCCPFVNAGAEA